MVSNIDFAFPLREFIGEECDYYDDFYGECEECGVNVPERTLGQCEFGFCGKFVCENCGFRCFNCEGNLEPYGYCFCSSHAEIMRPMCCQCKERYCYSCTKISTKKCDICCRHLCSQCENEERHFPGPQNRCTQCDSKEMKSLQDLCRSRIRQKLAAAKHKNNLPKVQINEQVKSLPLPTQVKNYISFDC